MVGISFGVVSSAITALHSVVIKKSLDVVKGSALHLSWYTNLLSAAILIPGFIIMGELPEVNKLLFEPELNILDTSTADGGGMTKLGTFLWGSLITVSLFTFFNVACLRSTFDVGRTRILDEHSKSPLYQSNITYHPYGLERRSWCRRCPPRSLAIRRYPEHVRTSLPHNSLSDSDFCEQGPYIFNSHHPLRLNILHLDQTPRITTSCSVRTRIRACTNGGCRRWQGGEER